MKLYLNYVEGFAALEKSAGMVSNHPTIIFHDEEEKNFTFSIQLLMTNL